MGVDADAPPATCPVFCRGQKRLNPPRADHLFEHLYSKRIVGTGRGSTNPRLVTVGGSGFALAIGHLALPTCRPALIAADILKRKIHK